MPLKVVCFNNKLTVVFIFSLRGIQYGQAIHEQGRNDFYIVQTYYQYDKNDVTEK